MAVLVRIPFYCAQWIASDSCLMADHADELFGAGTQRKSSGTGPVDKNRKPCKCNGPNDVYLKSFVVFWRRGHCHVSTNCGQHMVSFIH